jgi:hypothetical protein
MDNFNCYRALRQCYYCGTGADKATSLYCAMSDCVGGTVSVKWGNPALFSLVPALDDSCRPKQLNSAVECGPRADIYCILYFDSHAELSMAVGSVFTSFCIHFIKTSLLCNHPMFKVTRVLPCQGYHTPQGPMINEYGTVVEWWLVWENWRNLE